MPQTNYEARKKLREQLREKRSQRTGKSVSKDKVAPFMNVEKMALEGDDPQVLDVLQKVLKNPSGATSILQKMKSTPAESSLIDGLTTHESSDDEEEGLPPYVQAK